MGKIDLIIPTFNEEKRIREHLEFHSKNFPSLEITVVDGNSNDETRKKIRNAECDNRLIERSPAGRAVQLQAGVNATCAEWIIFLHADSWLPENFRPEDITNSDHQWGWFDIKLDNDDFIYSVISKMINIRSTFLRNPTGDQAIWLHRKLLEKIGGVPRLKLMEDMALVDQLRRHDQGNRISKKVMTSARRWEKTGVVKTILTMWSLKLAYRLGISPDRLDSIYRSKEKSIQ